MEQSEVLSHQKTPIPESLNRRHGRPGITLSHQRRNGMAATAVHPDGFLGYIHNVGDRPESSQPITYDSTADFGVGAFLLAGSELAGLAR
ncbi:hypothetical protein GCM10009744_27190 [Kribbella alba]|uniref:Uncharacterized protein n=2 Tax=Kribbella alba TaxID=190197 RepID=A0ABN2FBA4_9ACTN